MAKRSSWLAPTARCGILAVRREQIRIAFKQLLDEERGAIAQASRATRTSSIAGKMGRRAVRPRMTRLRHRPGTAAAFAASPIAKPPQAHRRAAAGGRSKTRRRMTGYWSAPLQVDR